MNSKAFEERRHEEYEKKICPMSFDSHHETYGHCVEKKCAWWDKNAEACAVAMLGNIPYLMRNKT